MKAKFISNTEIILEPENQIEAILLIKLRKNTTEKDFYIEAEYCGGSEGQICSLRINLTGINTSGEKK